jgi:NADH dehydrogenase
MNVARELAKLLPSPQETEIRLVDQNNFLLFTPMLTEVAGGELDPRHIVASPRRLAPRIAFQQGVVKNIDLPNRSVVLETGKLSADHLVIALGSVPNYHHVPGLREHSLGMKSVADAAAIRNRALACLERANWEADAALRRELLTFVVGGGGYTGVETMAAVNDMVRDEAAHYPNIRHEEITTIIVEPGERLLAELSADLAAYAQQKLENHGVQMVLKTKITGASANYVELENRGRIPTRTLIWAGGVTPNPLIEKLDCRRGHHGAVVVDDCCAVPGHPGVWAIGDCAEVPKPGSNGSYAPTAQNAVREGALVARNIAAALRGQTPKPFRYRSVGELALVGRHSGVGKLYGRRFSSFAAWALWRAVYVSKMPGPAF